ncbi:MAG: 30S ribosomal protein S12 methylthiotransferase RimO [Lachnospiraceae bacterium]|nr:30S ribosomal protein S12 methylthiotransferase RimO [Lachnospiraceae bacterium]
MRIYFVSLGCDKNLVDSEYMLGLLREAGHTLTEDEADAEAIIINTCCFIHDAKEESIETILEAASFKEKGVGCCRALVVTGCLAERYRSEIMKSIPEVDAVLGTASFDEIVNALAEAEAGKKAEVYKELTYLPLPDAKRVNTTCGYTAYLKIADGCEKFCTYCVIPSIRGKYRSVPMERILSEAEQLAKDGAKELILVAQETTLYGVDLYGKKMLPELLRKLCTIEGPEWIRLLYCYPEEITDELITVMKEEKKICRYLDLPIQHASDTVLKRMGRRTTKKDLLRLIRKLRRTLPGIVLRTSLITGFPGETEEEHKELLSFVEEVRFDRLGVFTYSKEENTPAAKMKGQVPVKDKRRRQKEIMKLQQQIAFENADNRIGKRYQALIEGKMPQDHVYLARTYMDAPNIDGYLFVESEEHYESGEFVKVKVTGAKGYDLVGVNTEKKKIV